MQQSFPSVIGNVRGLGLMVAMEITDKEGNPDGKMTAYIKEKALENQVLLLTCGRDHNVVRFIAPLTVSKEEIDLACDVIEEILKS